MEECEALCTKLGIMVYGQFQCFGNIQHLKSKYGKGYSLILKCRTDTIENNEKQAENTKTNVELVENFISTRIPNSVLKDKQLTTLHYQILFDESSSNTRKQELSIAEIFNLIESNKDSLNLETYSLSQTTLEQIFLTFANNSKYLAQAQTSSV